MNIENLVAKAVAIIEMFDTKSTVRNSTELMNVYNLMYFFSPTVTNVDYLQSAPKGCSSCVSKIIQDLKTMVSMYQSSKVTVLTAETPVETIKKTKNN
jgi:hypothetical protein